MKENVAQQSAKVLIWRIAMQNVTCPSMKLFQSVFMFKQLHSSIFINTSVCFITDLGTISSTGKLNLKKKGWDKNKGNKSKVVVPLSHLQCNVGCHILQRNPSQSHWREVERKWLLTNKGILLHWFIPCFFYVCFSVSKHNTYWLLKDRGVYSWIEKACAS